MDTKKVLKAVGIGVVLLGAGFAVSHYAYPNNIVKEVPIEITKTVEVIKEVPVEKLVTEIKYVDKEVAVDNGNLNKVMSFVEDNIDEDITVDYILFETDAKIEAESYIREEYKALLDDEDYFDTTFNDFRKSEVSVKKISDATVEDRDYDNKDVVLVYDVKIKAYEDSDHKLDTVFRFTIPFEKGILQSDDVEIELLE